MSVACAAAPVHPCAHVIALVVSCQAPTVVPVTATENMQLPFGMSREPPEKLTELGGVATTAPPHAAVVSLATVRPAGRVSVKARPDIAAPLVFGFVTLKVRVDVAPRRTEEGLKAFVSASRSKRAPR